MSLRTSVSPMAHAAQFSWWTFDSGFDSDGNFCLVGWVGDGGGEWSGRGLVPSPPRRRTGGNNLRMHVWSETLKCFWSGVDDEL